MQDNTSPQDQQSTPQPPTTTQGVVLVGKTATDKKPQQQLAKKSMLSRYFGVGTTKKPTTQAKPAMPNVPEQVLMEWTAPEFTQTHKPAGWYLGFGLFFVVLIALAVLTRQYITVGLFAVMAVAVLVYANRAPRALQYKVSNYGVYVGDKKYLYDQFDAYYETDDYGQTILELVPNKRFGTLVSLPPADHHLIELEDMLSQMLPKVDNRDDFIDKLFRKLRF